MYDEYEHINVLYTSNCDAKGWWKFSSILDVMQTTADRHNELLSCSRVDIENKGLTWVLFKTIVCMDRFPKIGERVAVRTYTKKPSMHFIPRYYELTDTQGNIMGNAGSFWVLVDNELKKPYLPQKKGVIIPENTNLPFLVNLMHEHKKISGSEKSFNLKPDYCDIDINGHVNNIRYVDWLYNALGSEILEKSAINYICICYNYEVLPGDIINNILTVNNSEVTFCGYNNDRPCFQIYATLKNVT